MAVQLQAAWEAAQQVYETEVGIGDFVSGPTPTNPVAAGIQNRLRQGCQNLSANPNRGLGGLAGAADVKAVMGTFCGPYWASQNYDAPTAASPFSGGQCQGVSYRIFITVISSGGQVLLGPGAPAENPNRSGMNSWTGPIGGIRIKRRNDNPQRWTWAITANGVEIDGTTSIPEEPRSASITSVVRTDGSADNCGSPDPVTVPGPNPAPDNGEAADFDVDIDNNVILPDEVISTPFGDFFLSELVEGILGTLTKGGGSDIDPRLLGNGNPQLDAPQSENGNDGQGGGDEDFGEPPEGRVCIGGIVEVVGGDELYGNIAGSGPENKVYPRVIGNASLKLEGDNSGIIRGTAEQIRSGWTSIFTASPGLKVTGLRVSVLPQIRYVVYPVSVIDKDSLSNPPEV